MSPIALINKAMAALIQISVIRSGDRRIGPFSFPMQVRSFCIGIFLLTKRTKSHSIIKCELIPPRVRRGKGANSEAGARVEIHLTRWGLSQRLPANAALRSRFPTPTWSGHAASTTITVTIMTKKLSLSLAVSALLALASVSPAQTLQSLVHQPPGGAFLAFQLTDGTVMFQANRSQDWWKLTPDISGSYLNGTWSQLASLQPGYVPDDFASAVLADGRVVITGGEYNNGQFTLTNMGAVYDPVANTWTPLPAPPGWDFIGDSASVVLPDGRFVVGRKLDMQVAVLDPATLSWTLLGSAGKADFNAEEGWTLLPDGTVFTFDVKNAPNSERYFPDTQT
jgi:hypothetical protein